MIHKTLSELVNVNDPISHARAFGIRYHDCGCIDGAFAEERKRHEHDITVSKECIVLLDFQGRGTGDAYADNDARPDQFLVAPVIERSTGVSSENKLDNFLLLNITKSSYNQAMSRNRSVCVGYLFRCFIFGRLANFHYLSAFPLHSFDLISYRPTVVLNDLKIVH